MEKLLEKITSYNLFNYLLPGLVFGWMFIELEFFEFPTDSIMAALVAAYALGLLISRLGSLLLEPMFRKLKFLHFSDYADYVKACDSDQKIELFVEQANSYRTFLAGFILILAAYPAVALANIFGLAGETRAAILLVGGALVFAWSYKKQSDFVSKRVAARTPPKD